MSIAAANAYHDFQGLASLRSDAVTAPGQNLKEVAAQFEAIFFQMMLKSMREATVEGDLFNSSQLETYQQMFDQQLSLDLSRSGGLGLAEILVEQLGAQKFTQRDADAARSDEVGRLELDGQLHGLSREQATPAPVASHSGSAAAPLAAAANAPATDWRPASAEEFIQDIWQHAVDAAAELGVDPAVLVAQSALETGWGKKVIRAADGSSSLNLFGIKAGRDWQGKSAAVNTLEYRDGVAAMERAAFRAYDSLSDAFADYVGLLKSSPRYQGALAAAGDGRGFLRGLQEAGYATDPAYADKIMQIMAGGSYANVIQFLKNSAQTPLSG